MDQMTEHEQVFKCLTYVYTVHVWSWYAVPLTEVGVHLHCVHTGNKLQNSEKHQSLYIFIIALDLFECTENLDIDGSRM